MHGKGRLTYPKLESLGLEDGSYKLGEWDEGEMLECIWYDKKGHLVKIEKERTKSQVVRSISISEEWNYTEVDEADNTISYLVSN